MIFCFGDILVFCNNLRRFLKEKFKKKLISILLASRNFDHPLYDFPSLIPSNNFIYLPGIDRLCTPFLLPTLADLAPAHWQLKIINSEEYKIIYSFYLCKKILLNKTERKNTHYETTAHCLQPVLLTSKAGILMLRN